MRERLVQLREAATLTQEEAAERIHVSLKSIYRWEAGERRPQMAHRRRMAEVYGVALSVIHQALDESLNGHSVPDHLRLFSSLEQGATELQTWQSVSMPGLLQTESYARAVESVGPTSVPAEEVEKRVARRLQRQAVLRKADPLRLFALIDASVLLRTTGGPEVMGEQLDHLLEMSELPNVEVRVVPLRDAAHAAGVGTFTLFTGAGSTHPYSVATGTIAGPQHLEFPYLVSAYETLFSYLWKESDVLAKVDLQQH